MLAPLLLLAAQPVFLEPNVGQAPSGVLIQGRGDRTTLRVRADAIALEGIVLRFDGGRARAPRFEAPLEARVREVHLDRTFAIPAHGRSELDQVWPGISLGISAKERFELDLTVAAGADPSRARFIIDGEAKVEDGALIIRRGDEKLTMSRPIAWQLSGGRRSTVDAEYRLSGRRVGFRLGAYDRARPLFIDPVLEYATYTPSTFGNLDVAADATSVYFAGLADLGAGSEPDLYVAKLDPTVTGTASLIYATFFSGDSGAPQSGVFVSAADVSSTGRLLVCGSQNQSFFSTDLRFAQNGAPEIGNAVAMVISADGGTVDYVASFGDGGFYDCAFEEGAETFVVTGRIDGGARILNGVPGMTGVGYLGRFDPDDDPLIDDDSLLYGTRLGMGTTTGEGVAPDPSGSVSVLLSAYTIDGLDIEAFVDASSFQSRHDQFGVCKFAPALGANALLACTYLGGTEMEGGVVNEGGIVADALGRPYVLIGSSSLDWPTAPGGPTPVGPGFLALTRLTADLSDLEFSFFTEPDLFASAADVELLPDGSIGILDHSGGGSWTYPSCALPGFGAGNLGSHVAVIASDGSRMLFASRALGLSAVGLATLPDRVVVAGTILFDPAFNTLVNGFQSAPSPTGLMVLDVAETCVDLGITGGASASILTAGDVLHYVVTVENLTLDTATGVEVAFELPPQLFLLDAEPSQGSCTAGAPLICNLGSIAGSATAGVDLTLLANTPGAGNGSARVTTAAFDLDPSNDETTFGVSISPGTGPCAGVGVLGRCTATVLDRCLERGTPTERLETVDCAADAFPTGVGGDCILIDATLGFDCAVLEGEPCRFDDEYAYCAAPEGGCLLGLNDTTECVSIPAAAGCAAAVGTCLSDALAIECHGPQVIAQDCAASGGTCVVNACELAPDAGVVDGGGGDPDGSVNSDAGSGSDGATGADANEVGNKDASVSIDTGTGGEGDDGGCSCSVRRERKDGLAGMALLVALFFWRRRRRG